jgi:hypothetical protein
MSAWLTTQGFAESNQSAAGRRKARKFRKHNRAAALLFLLSALALFEYLPLLCIAEMAVSRRETSF